MLIRIGNRLFVETKQIALINGREGVLTIQLASGKSVEVTEPPQAIINMEGKSVNAAFKHEDTHFLLLSRLWEAGGKRADKDR